jgi:hypothetical protein
MLILACFALLCTTAPNPHSSFSSPLRLAIQNKSKPSTREREREIKREDPRRKIRRKAAAALNKRDYVDAGEEAAYARFQATPAGPTSWHQWRAA